MLSFKDFKLDSLDDKVYNLDALVIVCDILVVEVCSYYVANGRAKLSLV